MINEVNLTMFKMGLKKGQGNAPIPSEIGSSICDFCSYQNHPDARLSSEIHTFRFFVRLEGGWIACGKCRDEHSLK
jgi:hypothetical protein